MAKRKGQRQGFGGPGVKTGGSIGPSLNPLGMAQTGPGTKYLDPTIAAQAWKEEGGSEWDRFWRDEKAVARFGKPVQSRS